MVFVAVGFWNFRRRGIFKAGIVETMTLGWATLARIDRRTLLHGTSLCVLPVLFGSDPFRI
jgi:hypothetical protein